MAEIVYKYRPRSWLILFLGGFFIPMTYVLFNQASHNQEGLIINHIIPLSVGQATVFFWGLFGLFATLSGLIVFGFINGLTSKGTLRLSETALFVSNPFNSRQTRTIAYAEVTNLSTTMIRDQAILNVHHKDGKICVSESMMPSKARFEEMVQQLVARITEARRT